MQCSFVRLCFTVVLGWMTCSATFLMTKSEGQPASSPPAAEDSLRRFLAAYVRNAHLPDDKTTRYSYAFVDLNGDGKNEVIVHLQGRWWCGTGGCPTLVLASEDASYRVITKILITRPPIKVLTTLSRGWRNISVWVQGGGVEPGYTADLPFDGRTYPMNPSMPPARRLIGEAAGQVVISSSEDGKLLYP